MIIKTTMQIKVWEERNGSKIDWFRCTLTAVKNNGMWHSRLARTSNAKQYEANPRECNINMLRVYEEFEANVYWG